ncbi:unnamed protein product [Orchesella dallaii]|uniref:Chitin-binding type-2 domain-containing protein n=1 Tax=Orchesella dallaii TaxID=48710 RepID=A0ABP1QAM9_9HEXA
MKVFPTILLLAVGIAVAASQTPPDYATCDVGDDDLNPPDCPPDGTGDATYFPFPYDCTKYFECTNGDARCIQCPVETVWDQDLLTCNHESSSACVTATTTGRPTTTTPTTTTPTTTTPTTTTPTTTTPTTTTPTTTTTEPTTTLDPGDPIHWICPDGYVGRMGHPFNCSYFYICDPGRRPCLFECLDGLYYNPISMDCDWPQNVPTCVDGTPPPPISTPRTNYRNTIRQHSSEKQSVFSFFSIFKETITPGSQDPCEEPELVEKYYRMQ